MHFNAGILTIVLCMSATLSIAQEKKQFTLQDLIPGGETYNAVSVPKRLGYFWDGDVLQLRDTDRKWVGAYRWGKGISKDESLRTDPAPALAYSEGYNLYINTEDGGKKAVTTDGSIDVVYGESVHRNEFGIDRGIFPSPAKTKIAFYRMDQTDVSAYPQIDITSRCAEVVPDKYPMAGETSHKVTVGIYDTKTEQTVYLDAGDPTNRYFTNIAWSPDGKFIYMIELNREQNHAQLMAYDANTGKRASMVLEEKSEKYVEPMHPIMFLPWDSNKFIYQTRRNGYNHIYLYDVSGRLLKQLTNGPWEVTEVLGWCEAQKTLVYAGNEKHPLQQNLFMVDMNGKKTALDNGKGWHEGVLSEGGSYICDEWSEPADVAKKIDVISILARKTDNILTADEPWDGYDVPEIKVGTIKAADGRTDLWYRMVLPTGFDPAKKYPAVVYVYGGPHAHMIDASRHWNVRGWDIWMAQKGYAVFTLDNRGSEHRGLEFEQTTFHKLGEEEMKDQMEGVKLMKTLPYIDGDRIGVHGWSFGGFMTTSLMTTYPDVFKVGVAGGPVIDWKYYEVMYGERYMGTPQSNPEGYRNSSLLNKAGNLKGRLLVIYGGNDTTCVPQHTLSFIRACIDAGTYPDLFTYPGSAHNMRGMERVHLHEKITSYFDDFLKKKD